MKKIVVIGGGWAASSFIKHLDSDKYNVHVISPTLRFTYTPLLPKQITCNISTSIPIQDLNESLQYHENKVIDVHFDKNQIQTDNREFMSYDYVIFAHGSDVNTYGVSGVLENTFCLKNDRDAIELQQKIKSIPPRSNICVIGSGPTGTEIVGYLSDKGHYLINVVDICASPLQPFCKSIQDYTVSQWLKNDNINMFFRHKVKSIDKSMIHVSDLKTNTNHTIPYDVAIWCGGIAASPLTNMILEKIKYQTKKGIPVDPMLRIPNIENAYAIGDCTDTEYPPTAQVAYQQGQFLAEHFNHDCCSSNTFELKDKGKIVYIGNKKSVFETNLFHSYGYFTYVFNQCVHVYNGINIYQKLMFLFQ